MQESNRFKLGMFVCFSFLLFVAILIFLGSMDSFRDKAYLMTLVSESVQGLNPGASVKYQGVPIGKVTDITIETESRLIRIDMEINLSKIRPGKEGILGGNSISLDQFYNHLETNIMENGLRCKLDSEGITGTKYIEFDFAKAASDKFLIQPGVTGDGVFFVPSVPSLMSDLRTSVVSILEKLESIDYKGLTQKIEKTVDDADRLLTDPKFKSILENLDKASGEIVVTVDELRKTITGEKVKSLLNNSELTMVSIRQLSDMVNKELTDAQIGKTASKVRISLDAFRNSNFHFVETMNKIDEGVDALVELIQLLDNDPASLIHGKTPPHKDAKRSDRK